MNQIDIDQFTETQLIAVCCFGLSRIANPIELMTICGVDFLETIARSIELMSEQEQLAQTQKAINRLVEMKNTQEVWSGE